MSWMNQVRDVSHRALETGELQPFEVKNSRLPVDGIEFICRLKVSEQKSESKKMTSNPFHPYNPALYVRDVGPNHHLLLNKYNVVKHALCVVTREVESQRDDLTFDDVNALWITMENTNGFGFYNCGTVSGSSQPHKHMQIIPEEDKTPIEKWVEDGVTEVGKLTTIPQFRFKHFFVRYPSDVTSEKVYHEYRRMREALEMEEGQSYNYITTKQWGLVVPRTKECDMNFSHNSLAFLGFLLATSQDDIDELVQRPGGVMSTLENVAVKL